MTIAKENILRLPSRPVIIIMNNPRGYWSLFIKRQICKECMKQRKELVVDGITYTVHGSRFYFAMKRLTDIFLSLLILIIFCWLYLILAIIVRLTSKGPAIYVSDRVGKNGRVFKFYKFRSMRVGAEQELENLLKENEMEGGVTFKMKEDPRVTKFGRFIRRTSLDELPQIWNILKGDMSFVGPRPCTTREYELYNEYDKVRLLVPQGLTGEWQVHGRSTTTFEQMIEFDVSYVTQKCSYLHDIYIFLKTFIVIFKKGEAE